MTRRRPLAMTAFAFLLVTACGKQAGDSGNAAAPAPEEILTDSGVPMILLPGGVFRMGSDGGNPDEQPVHEVAVSPFLIDKFEVTQDQFAALEVPNPAHFKGPRRPVEQVRWSDAALFCNERSRSEGLAPCYDEVTFACDFEANGYRLPTEAEWEYADRAGTTTDYDFGNDPRSLKNHACFAENAAKKTALAGRKRPNRWGLHDMYGNVLEWCHDAYSPEYYGQSPAADPRGPAQGLKRVMRGGAWNSSAQGCRSACRYAEMPGITDACFARDSFGFRCVRRPSGRGGKPTTSGVQSP